MTLFFLTSVTVTLRPSQPEPGDLIVLSHQPLEGANCTFSHHEMRFHSLPNARSVSVIPPSLEAKDVPEKIPVKMICTPSDGTVPLSSTIQLPVRRQLRSMSYLRVPPETVTFGEEEAQRLEREQKERNRLVAFSFPTFIDPDDDLFSAAPPVMGPLSSPFNSPRSYNNRFVRHHTGVDFAVAEGTRVQSPLPGVVLLTQNALLLGHTVVIHHGSGLVTAYAHLSSITVKAGDWVDRSLVLGTTGKSGRVTGPHLHWEAYWYGERFNAASLLKLPQSQEKTLSVQLTRPRPADSVDIDNLSNF